MDFFYRIWGLRKLLLIIQSYIFNLIYRRRFGNKIRILGLPIISMHKKSKIDIGKNVLLISHSYFSQPGINHPVIIRLMSDNASLKIGNDVGISGGGICVQTEVTIGNNVMFGANSFVTDTDFHPIVPENRRYSQIHTRSKKVVIEDNVFLGMNTIVLKGVTIGKNSVIGAGSVVIKDIPSNQIWAGNPAKFVRDL